MNHSQTKISLHSTDKRWMARIGILCLAMLGQAAMAQVGVSDGGTPSYSRAIVVPPGVAGMTPKLALMYSGGGVNGPVGYGWSLQGLSMITRCAATVAVDGKANRAAVKFVAADKLCLDGQRLIETEANGTVKTVAQPADAGGVSTGTREFRTEKDSFARIRAYGMAVSGDANSGPAYFKVWTKSGQIYEYGALTPAGSTSDGLVTNKIRVGGQDRVVGMVWAVTRISDTLGNAIDFSYEKRYKPWGTVGSDGTSSDGREWNIQEIRYVGGKVVFGYDVASGDVDQRPDKSEAYQQGFKNLSLRRLKTVSTSLYSPGPGPSLTVAVSTLKLSYEQGPITGRSRVIKLQECAGDAASTRCLPATSFAYSEGTKPELSNQPEHINFNLQEYKLASIDGKYGVLVGDFNGDGLSDLLRWSEAGGGENELWLSKGDGSFGKFVGFSIGDILMKANGCYYTMVVDANGDGLHDLVRVPSAKANDGTTACGVPMQADYYINRGNGQFTKSTLSTGTGPIAMERKTSTWNLTSYCGAVPVVIGPDNSSSGTQAATAGCTNPTRTAVGWPSGATFYFIDVDGDGKLDLITSKVNQKLAVDPGVGAPPDPDLQTPFLPCTGCTRVYLAVDGEGQFVERVDHAMKDVTVYSDPGSGANLQSLRRVVDQNGDGLADLMGVGTPYKKASWRSKGNGDFEPGTVVTWDCLVPIDFNGDARADCLQASSSASTNRLIVSTGVDSGSFVPDFNLVNAGQEMVSAPGQSAGQNFGVTIVDVDGDGRQDIVRWHDDPSLNRYYRSLGDGKFVDESMPGGDTQTKVFAGIQLKHSDGKFDFVTGDFTGRGVLEILRIAPQGQGPLVNRNWIYTQIPQAPGVPAAPDMLTQVTTGTGATTTLKYASLTHSAVADTDKRYFSDRQTPNAATVPNVDLSVPLWVVTSMQMDSGLGAPNSTLQGSEYSYVGLKANIEGRGMLGFREVRRQASAPNGQPLTTITQYLNTHPYIGVASNSRTVLGTVNQTGAPVISEINNEYCDKTAAAGALAAVNVTKPCPTQAKVAKPYLYRSTETGFDLEPNRVALPTVVTTNSYNEYGDPVEIKTETQGTSAGIAQKSTKVTSNTYPEQPDTGCTSDTSCNWVLGRLTKASVESTVDDLIGRVTTGAGSGPYATKTVGEGPLPAAGWNVTVTANNAQALSATKGAAPATGTVIFKNTGTQAANLTMSGLTAPYSVSPTACTAAANGGTCTVTVSMATTGATGSQGAQTLTASCCGATAATAPVSGTLTSNQQPTTVTLDFEGIPAGTDLTGASNPYNTAAYGFTTFSGSAATLATTNYEGDPTTALWSPCPPAPAGCRGVQASLTITIASPFQGSTGLLVNVANAGQLGYAIWSAAGVLLASGSFSPPSGTEFRPTPVLLPFSGLAKSISFTGEASTFAIDNLRFPIVNSVSANPQSATFDSKTTQAEPRKGEAQ